MALLAEIPQKPNLAGYDTETKPFINFPRIGDNMQLRDDRTDEQKQTHNWIVIGTDTFMTGWGRSSGGNSYAGWACKPEDVNKVERWVANRSDMKRVRVVAGDYRPNSRFCADCHIYVTDENHPSLD